jgi:ABC-type antimicrobial peptide transport system permease subunit
MHDGKFIDANLLLNIKPYLQLNEALKNIFVNDSNKVIISRKLQLKLFGNNSAIGRQINIGLLKTDKSKLTPVTIAGIYNNNSVNAIFVSRSIATSITGNNRALWANSYIVRLKDKYFSKDWRKKLRDENIKLRDEAKFKLAKLYDKTSEAYKKLENQLQKAESNLNFLRPFQIQSWMDVSPENLEYLKITRAIMLVVFISILILSGLSIKFLFDTIVIEKKRQISILKTLGYSDLSILNAFIMSGAFIGFTGVLIGIALGYTLNWTTGLLEQQYFEQSFFFQYRSILPSLTFTGKVIILVMVLCMASALPSALRVMKTRPIEGIRRDN